MGSGALPLGPRGVASSARVFLPSSPICMTTTRRAATSLTSTHTTVPISEQVFAFGASTVRRAGRHGPLLGFVSQRQGRGAPETCRGEVAGCQGCGQNSVAYGRSARLSPILVARSLRFAGQRRSRARRWRVRLSAFRGTSDVGRRGSAASPGDPAASRRTPATARIRPMRKRGASFRDVLSIAAAEHPRGPLPFSLAACVQRPARARSADP